MRRTHLSLCAIVAAAALAAILVTPTAQAGGPLFNWQPGQPWLWPGGGANIPFNPDQGGLGTLDNAAAVALTEAAFAQWAAVPSASTTYVNAGLLPVDVDITNFWDYYDPIAPDGYSAIVYDENGEIFDYLYGPGSGVLGFSSPEWGVTATGEITEGVSFLNGGAILGGVQVPAYFAVEVHEFGHYNNLAHTVVNGEIGAFLDYSGPNPYDTWPLENLFGRIETMYPFIFLAGDGSEQGGVATPHPDDIAILSTLYPAPGFFADHGSITGYIYASDGTTKLTGVNVIARNVVNPYDDAVSAISSDFTEGFSQSDPYTGLFTMNGLTPGETYAVFVDQILAGGFSTPIALLPGPEEFHNGVDESSDPETDLPPVYTGITVTAGVQNAGVDVIFNRPGPGDPLPVGDDGYYELYMPFDFEFCGESYNSVFVNANGNITFGESSGDFSESVADLLGGPPRIAGWWDDLNPTQGGIVTFDESNNTFTIIWDEVPEYYATGANSFQIVLNRSSNQIDLVYGDMTAEDGMAGFSCGGAVTIGNEMGSDISYMAESGTINGRVSPAIYEQFSFVSPNDLANTTAVFTAPNEFVDKSEPNNSLGDATKVKLPFSSGDQIGDSPLFSYTEIAPAGADIDWFEFDAVAGGSLLVEVAYGELDTVIGLFDADTGAFLAGDDDGGSGLLSKLVYPIMADGTYAVAVTTYPDYGFTGAGNGSGRYVMNVETVSGIILDLGDDDTEEVNFPTFTFPYQGVNWTSVWVNSNGNLTFGTGDTDYSESISEFLNGPPRIAPLWDDLRRGHRLRHPRRQRRHRGPHRGERRGGSRTDGSLRGRCHVRHGHHLRAVLQWRLRSRRDDTGLPGDLAFSGS
jgi:hypothetical protein